jgi:DNA-binding NarL/FixJ family response regulator
MPIKISLVKDIQGVRERLAALLNEVPGMICVGAHATGEEAVEKIPADQPDVALVDVHLPGMNGIECVARLKAQLLKPRILMQKSVIISAPATTPCGRSSSTSTKTSTSNRAPAPC